jgi:hypothetical protein
VTRTQHPGRLRRILLVGGLAAGLLTAVPTAALAHGKMHCNDARPDAANGYGRFDPIVAPGVEPFGHEHAFFGSNALLQPGQRANATYASLVGTSTDCSNPGDSAVYWAPAVYQVTVDAQGLATARRMTWKTNDPYYRPWFYPVKRQDQTASSGTVPHPPDARIIAGDPTSTGPQAVVRFHCNEGSSRPGPYDSWVQAACHTATGTVVRAGVRVDLPQCFAGTSNSHSGPGNTADYTGRSDDGVIDRYAYATGTATNPTCPAGFTASKVAAIRQSLQILNPDGTDYRGDGRDLALSSGPWSNGRDGVQGTADDYPIPGEASQYTMHVDFWNTWVQGTPGTTGNTYWGMVTRCDNTNTSHAHGSTTTCGN